MISKIFLFVIEYKNASLSYPKAKFSLFQLLLVKPPKISSFSDLIIISVGPLLLQHFLKSLLVSPLIVEVYIFLIFEKLILFFKVDIIKVISSSFFIILESLKKNY